MVIHIPGYVREARPGEFPDRPRPRGYRLVVVDELARGASFMEWRTASPGRRCRFTVGPGYKQCQLPAVVELNRGHRRPSWWGYCGNPAHLFGRTWDATNRRLLAAVLVPESGQP